MRRFTPLLLVTLLCAGTSIGWTYYKEAAAGAEMTDAASQFVELLTDEQRADAMLPYDAPQRVDWHFIPKEERKGVQIKHMSDEQRQAAMQLVEAALSQMGYRKTKQIMALEGVIHELEGDRRRFARDSQRYYVTLFGEPSADGRWGLSFEGHHLSLNFVVEKGQIIASTPQFFGANPGEVKDATKTGVAKGTRVLAKEEQLGFELINALPDDQQQQAVLSETAPKEIREPGSAQPPQGEPEGLPAGKLSSDHKKLLRQIIRVYANAVPASEAKERLETLNEAGFNKIHFAWAGAMKPGIGHYYRITGPTFLIEFVNTQPDAAGNPANHVHCVWRDLAGDFAIPVE